MLAALASSLKADAVLHHGVGLRACQCIMLCGIGVGMYTSGFVVGFRMYTCTMRSSIKQCWVITQYKAKHCGVIDFVLCIHVSRRSS